MICRCLLTWLRVTWCCLFFIFFFKQKTAYEMRISDWSSDVCSSDLWFTSRSCHSEPFGGEVEGLFFSGCMVFNRQIRECHRFYTTCKRVRSGWCLSCWRLRFRSEEHTSELQSLMRISYAVFCLKNKNKTSKQTI